MAQVSPEHQAIADVVALHPDGISHADLMTELENTGKSALTKHVYGAKRAKVIQGQTIQAADGEKPVLFYKVSVP